MKKLLYGLVAVLVLLIGAAFVAPSFIDWNRYKPGIVSAVESATGRALAIDGPIDLSLLPRPTLSVKDARLANIPEGSAEDMIQLAALDVRVELMPLFGGNVEVASVTLVEPVVFLERTEGGRANWTLDVPAEPEAAPAEPSGLPGPVSVSLDQVRIENGTIIYRDAATGMVERVENLTADLTAESLTGPFTAEGSASVRGALLDFEFGVGEIDAATFPLRVALSRNDATIAFSGTAATGGESPRLNGKLTVAAPDPQNLLAAFAQDAMTLPASLKRPLNAEATVTAEGSSVEISEFEARLGDSVASGTASARFAELTEIDADLAVNRIDLDAFLAPPATGAETEAEAAGEATGAEGTATGDGEAAAAFQIPSDVKADIALSIDALLYNENVVRQIIMEASVGEGAINLDRLSALLPGGSDVTVFGVAETVEDRLRFTGQVDAASDNLRSVLDWLEIETPDVPADRLRKVTFAADIVGWPDEGQISNIDLRIDATRLTGGVAYVLGDRPAFGVNLSVDRFNLDAYAPGLAEPATGAEDAGADTADGDPMAFLQAFNADVKARIDQLTFRGAPISGIAFDGLLQNGTLLVREATVADLAGAAINLKGEARALASNPTLSADLGLETQNIGELARYAGVAEALPPGVSGPVRLDAMVDGALDALALDVTLAALNGEFSFDGSVVGGLASPKFDTTVGLDHPDLAALMEAMTGTPAGDAPPAMRSPVSVTATARGPLGEIAVNGEGSLGDTSIAVDGTVRGLPAEPAFDLAMEVNDPDLKSVLAGFGVSEGVAGVSGPLAIKGQLVGTPTAISIPSLDATLGDASVVGSLALDMAGPRPKVTADLVTGVIVVDRYLPSGESAAVGGDEPAVIPASQQGGAVNGSSAGTIPWSHDPIDFSGLRALDADLKLSADGLIYQDYRFDEAELALVLQDGVLEINRLSGTTFDGQVDLDARVAAADVPVAEVGFRLTEADVGRMLHETAEIDAVTGRVSLEGSLATEGRSQYELVSALSGQGTMAGGAGTIEGLDLRRISDRLDQLNRITDFVTLIAEATSGGTTQYQGLNGTFNVQNGVITTTDTVLDADAGRGTVEGRVDLPRWRLALDASFALTEHPDAPPIGIRLTGPIDAPEQNLQIERLQTYLAGRGLSGALEEFGGEEGEGVGRIIEDLTGGGEGTGGLEEGVGRILEGLTGGGSQQQSDPAPAEEPAPESQQEPRQQRPEEAIRDLFGDILQGGDR